MTNAEVYKLGVDNLISTYGENSCVQIIENKNGTYSYNFIEFKFNKEANKFIKRMKITLVKELGDYLWYILRKYLKNLTSNKDIDKKELKNLNNSYEFMYTLKDWKEMIDECS